MAFPRSVLYAVPLLLTWYPLALAVTLTWDYTDTVHTGFVLQRKAQGGAYTDLVMLSPGTRQYDDPVPTTPTPVSYCYVVLAYNETGRSDPSNETCVTLMPRPQAPKNLRVVGP